jgi:hypothetical protein
MTASPGGVRRGPTWGVAGALCLVVAAVGVGLRPMSDNSFLTHLATGRLILSTGSVPSSDPYTFTAHGEPWVVQSWLASWLYATVEALGGAAGLRALMGVIAALLMLMIWRLTARADGLLVRLAIAGLAVGVGAGLWAERPFMLGLVALAAVALAAEGRLDPRWLVPIGWAWVNVHGSFPLGLAYLVVVLVGRRLDGDDLRPQLQCLGWLAAGVVLGAASPVGPQLLLFPLELVSQQDVLQNVIEWRAPTFDTFSQRVFVVQLALAIILLARRPSYHRALVLAVFGAAALLGARNLTVASLLLVPGMAAAAPDLGTLRASGRAAGARALVGVAAVGLVLVIAVRTGQPDFNLRAYPVDALAYLDRRGIDLEDRPTATPDIAGNFIESVYGAGSRVFYDDRFDMFPKDVSAAHLSLVRSGPGVRDALDDHDIDLVVWGRESPLSQLLIADPAWRALYSDEGWMVLCRRGAPLGGDGDTC